MLYLRDQQQFYQKVEEIPFFQCVRFELSRKLVGDLAHPLGIVDTLGSFAVLLVHHVMRSILCEEQQ